MPADARLPEPGQVVTVDMARALQGPATTGVGRVVARDGLRIRLQLQSGAGPVAAGVPVVVRLGNGRQQLFGVVLGSPEPGVMELGLKAPPQRRQSERYPLGVDVDMEVIDDPDSVPLRCMAIDLSAGGLKVSVGSRVPPGAYVFTVIRLPGVEPAAAVCEVLDCVLEGGVYVARLQFTCISGDHMHRVMTFTDRLKNQPQPA